MNIVTVGNNADGDKRGLYDKDDETFGYNHHFNRLSTFTEHYKVRRAIDRGVSRGRLARAFEVDLSSINRRINLLEGIFPEAITQLKDKHPDATRILRNIKAAPQVEAMELIITAGHDEAIYAQRHALRAARRTEAGREGKVDRTHRAD